MSEVVTGILAAGLGGYAELALLPLGTGGDLRRTLGVPADLEGALAAIAGGERVRLDAGRAAYCDRNGREAGRTSRTSRASASAGSRPSS